MIFLNKSEARDIENLIDFDLLDLIRKNENIDYIGWIGALCDIRELIIKTFTKNNGEHCAVAIPIDIAVALPDFLEERIFYKHGNGYYDDEFEEREDFNKLIALYRRIVIQLNDEEQWGCRKEN